MHLISIWGVILATIIIIYVLLDGFDLGIGILFPQAQSTLEKDIMANTIIHVWDGNQTWLVMGGSVLYGAFPKAFASLLSILYMPVMLLVISLLIRGISLEFRLKAVKLKKVWDRTFFLGSICAAFMQGIILGTYVQGFGHETIGPHHVPHFAWLTWFSILAGIGVIFGYRLLGASYLIIKTSGNIQAHARKSAKSSLIMVLILMCAFSIFTPFMNEDLFARWLILEDTPHIILLPIVTAIIFILHFKYLNKLEYEKASLFFTFAEFICGYIGVCISVWPYIVPHSMVLTEAASPDSALRFMLVGISIMGPILIAYTIRSYHIFKGKVENVIPY